MCGACGERTAFDWARPWVATLPARIAVATAVLRRSPGPRPKVQADRSGWLVSAPTGARTACAGLTELVAAVRPWLGEPVELRVDKSVDPRVDRGAGRLAVPGPDLRQGLELRVSATAPPTPAWPPHPGRTAQPVIVRDEEVALVVLQRLAAPPWSLRYYLAALHGVSAAWGARPNTVCAGDAERGAELLVWAEHARQLGALDNAAVVLRCPLSTAATLDVEIRAGHVVRSRPNSGDFAAA